MGSTAILALIDEELARLHRVRASLVKKENSAAKAAAKSASSSAVLKRGKRQLSPAARERIAAAQRKRWATAKRAKKR